MEHKTLSLELKADTPGSFRAVFSTLNVIDKDNDVTLPGAFESGAPVNVSAWGHNWGDLPSGDGKIEEEDDEAIIDGSFYLGTPQGDATYNTLKQRLDRGVVTQEWSYGFEVLKASFGKFQERDVRFLEQLKVFEVSPVMVGAGIATRTLDMKGLTFADHGDKVLAALKEYAEMAKEGRVLSVANRNRLASLVEAVASVREELAMLLDETDPEKGRHEVERLFVESQRILAGIPAAS